MEMSAIIKKVHFLYYTVAKIDLDLEYIQEGNTTYKTHDVKHTLQM